MADNDQPETPTDDVEMEHEDQTNGADAEPEDNTATEELPELPDLPEAPRHKSFLEYVLCLSRLASRKS